MARSINWKNIAAPQSNPASAIAVASGAFSRGGAGAFQFAEQMDEEVERERVELTNRHITAALAGEPLPTDSRVDPTVVQEAVQSQNKFKSDELTAIMNRTGMGITQAQAALDLSQDPGRNTAELARWEAQTGASQAATARDTFGLTEDRRKSTLSQEIDNNRQRLQSRAFEDKKAIFDNFVEQGGAKYQADMETARPDWTPSERAADYKTNFLDVAKRQAENQFENNLPTWIEETSQELGIRAETAASTQVGQRQARFEAESLARASRVQEFKDKQQEVINTSIGSTREGGDNTGLVPDGTAEGGVRLLDKTAKTANRLKSTSASAEVWLKEVGIPVNDNNIGKAQTLINQSGNNRGIMNTAAGGEESIKDGMHKWKFWKTVRKPQWDVMSDEVDKLKGALKSFATGYVDPSTQGVDPAATVAGTLQKAERMAAGETFTPEGKLEPIAETPTEKVQVVVNSLKDAKKEVASLDKGVKERNPTLWRKLQYQLSLVTSPTTRTSAVGRGAARAIPPRNLSQRKESLDQVQLLIQQMLAADETKKVRSAERDALQQLLQ